MLLEQTKQQWQPRGQAARPAASRRQPGRQGRAKAASKDPQIHRRSAVVVSKRCCWLMVNMVELFNHGYPSKVLKLFNGSFSQNLFNCVVLISDYAVVETFKHGHHSKVVEHWLLFDRL